MHDVLDWTRCSCTGFAASNILGARSALQFLVFMQSLTELLPQMLPDAGHKEPWPYLQLQSRHLLLSNVLPQTLQLIHLLW